MRRPPPRTLARLGEERLLALLRRRFPARRRDTRVGIGDDAALVAPGGRDLLVSTDALVEGVDFRRGWGTPREVGRKTLSVNLSDLAAMGGEARWALLTLALPPGTPARWFEGFLDGFGSVARERGIDVIGGDLSSIGGSIVASATVLGVPAGKGPILRSGALPGDGVWVTGSLGDAALALRLLGGRRGGGCPPGLLRRLLDPTPPVALGAALGRSGLPHAMIDLSDGLALDLARLCRESRVGARIEAASIPRSAPFDRFVRRGRVPRGADPLALQLSGGEDFELLLAVPPRAARGVERLARAARVRLTRIGEMVRGRGVTLVGPDGVGGPLPPLGWQHFHR